MGKFTPIITAIVVACFCVGTADADPGSGLMSYSPFDGDAQLNVKGDVNLDGSLDLKDAVSALQLILGGTPSVPVNDSGDVNGDGKIGPEEAIYVLQVVAKMREQPDIDNDRDGFTENQGDCNDADPTIFAGATETCGDGIDQNCNGCDKPCPTGVSYAVEDFRSGSDGFDGYERFDISGGRLVFRRDQSD